MTVFVWKDHLDTGIARIDAQHRAMQEAIARMDALISAPWRQEELGPVITRLRELAHVHCADEENLMESVGFAGLAEHRAAHALLLLEADAFLEPFEVASDGPGNPDLGTFMMEWMNRHLMELDLLYARFIKQHRIQDPYGR